MVFSVIFSVVIPVCNSVVCHYFCCHTNTDRYDNRNNDRQHYNTDRYDNRNNDRQHYNTDRYDNRNNDRQPVIISVVIPVCIIVFSVIISVVIPVCIIVFSVIISVVIPGRQV
jgi:hypothetical protein